MIRRKVQITGKSSYIITLPKRWIKANQIQKQQEVGLTLKSDGSLLVIPDATTTHFKREKVLEYDENENPDIVMRKLYAAYITGYSAIKITSPKRISSPLRRIVGGFIKSVVGSEISHEDPSSLVIQNNIISEEITLEETLRRMARLVISMFEDIFEALETKQVSLLDDVINRDSEVNKLNHYMTRLMSQGIINPHFAPKVDSSLPMIQISFVIALYLELIGDSAVSIAKMTQEILFVGLTDATIKKLKKASLFLTRILEKCINSWKLNDLNLANETIEIYCKLKDYLQRHLGELSDFEKIHHIDCILDIICKTTRIATNISLISIDRDILEL